MDVREYLMKKYNIGQGPDQELLDAQRSANEGQRDANIWQGVNTIAGAIGGVKSDNSFYDNLRSQAQNPVSDLKNQRAMQAQNFGQAQDMEKAQKDFELDDSESKQNKDFRAIVKATAPKIADSIPPERFNKLTLRNKDDIFNFIRMRENADARKQEFDMKRQELANQKAFASTPEERTKKLSGTDKARFDNALMAIKALDEMDAALANGDNTFSLVGDNDYTSAERRATEAYGRMQSGGAINKEEEKRFSQTLPRATDAKKIQAQKIKTQREEMISRLKTLGFSPSQAGYEPKELKYGQEKINSDFPKLLKKDGKIATVNNENELKEAQNEGWK